MLSQTLTGKNNRKYGSVFLLTLFAMGLLFLLVRAKYGFCFNDEPFCVTLAQRLYQGDSLLTEEWHGCQLFSAVMLPFYSLFRLISPDNEGILLFMRHMYCILWWLCCIYVSMSVARHPVGIAAVFSFLLLFSPLDYMTISYTSLGLMSALVITCMLYMIPQEKIQKPVGSIVGSALFWAVLVLCSPFMAAAFIGLIAVVFCGARQEKKSNRSFYFRNLFAIYRRVILLDLLFAVLYLAAFVLLRSDLMSVIRSIPYILADPEHQSSGLTYALTMMFRQVITEAPVYIAVCCITCIYGFCAPKKRGRAVLFTVNAVLYGISQAVIIRKPYHFNVQMLAIVFLGAVAYALLERKNRKMFVCFYGFSAVFTVLNALASNTGIMAISMTLVVAGSAAVVFILQLAKELAEQYSGRPLLRTAYSLLICGVLCAQIGSECYVKINRQYWDAPLAYLNTRISCGSAKGLRTTSDIAAGYTYRYNGLKELLNRTDTEGKRFLSCTSAPYLYLDADLEFATFSAWSFGYEEGLNNRILEYQKLNPDKIPDLIYCGSQNDILPFIDDTYDRYEFDDQYLFVRKK